MKIDVMMTQNAEDLSSIKTRPGETKVRLHQRRAVASCRLAEQISAESFQVDLNARSGSEITWSEEHTRSINPDMETEASSEFGSKLDSGMLEGGDVDSSYWTRTSDEGSPVALASVDEDFHTAIRSLETGTSDDSRIRSESSETRKSPREDAERCSAEKGPEGPLAASPMETDISSFFSTSTSTSGTYLGIPTSKIQGLSPRQRLLYRYKLEELMNGNHIEETSGGAAGLPDEALELSASPEPAEDKPLDDESSQCYVDAPESSDSWQTSKSGEAEVDDMPIHPVTGLLHDCHICGYVPYSRDDYDSHMKKTHFTHKCRLCIYWSRSPGRLNHHMKKFHSEPGDTPANKKPKNPRKYTCKQCDYFTYVQEEIWNHTRVHVPASKLLSCPHCPFVCAFKHHMQYHMNNHMGYKPFKCSECNYRCNNKSMLNSHKKSHSNDYPFRCGVCNYAAKYRHALNIHLRKKKHIPDGEVLLEDRHRPVRTRNKVNQAQRNRLPDTIGVFPEEIDRRLSWSESQMGGIVDSVSIKEDPERMNISMHASFPQSQPIQPAYTLPGTKMQPPLIPISELPYHLMNPNYSSVGCPMPTLNPALAQNCTIPPLGSFIPSHGISIPGIAAPSVHVGQDHSALYETSPLSGVYSSSRQLPVGNKCQTFYESQELESMVHRSPRHYALETAQDLTNDSAEEWPLDLTAKSKEDKVKDTDCNRSWQRSTEGPKSLQTSRQSPQLDWYECQHCGIIFTDRILFSMHMGYHNKSDPFQCNLCGQRTKDRRDFFSHISMVAHD